MCGTWSFTGEEGDSQGDKKMRCSIMRYSACHVDRSERAISGKNRYYGQGP